MANRARKDIIFQNAITSTGNGTTFRVNDTEVVNIEFAISTSGTFTANFEGQIRENGVWLPIKTVNLSTLALATTASDATSVYQIDTIGFNSIRVRISALSGTLSCYGKAVY